MTRANVVGSRAGPTQEQFVAEGRGAGSDHFLVSYWLGPATGRLDAATRPERGPAEVNLWTRAL